MVRRATGLTASDLAERLGIEHDTVTQLEACPDMLISTLRNYLLAASAERPRVVTTLAGTDYELDRNAVG